MTEHDAERHGCWRRISFNAELQDSSERTLQNSAAGQSMDDRAFFLKHMIRMRNERRSYDPYFGNAIERFVNPYQAILTSPDTDRLARLIRRVVVGTSLGHELEGVDPATQPAADQTEEAPRRSPIQCPAAGGL
ncbi:hypothetical protein K8353_30970 [Burkholderia contaminans]|nr:hypothetical protein [Burkholderia contaminans]